ncbi:MAG: SPOR domain-containing protein [Pseudomonadota bacterium]
MVVSQVRDRPRIAVLAMAVLAGLLPLAACAEIEVGAEVAKRVSRSVEQSSGLSAATGTQLAQADTTTSPQAISPFLRPAPEIFEATGLAIWDGKRTLQGVWVAHPLASSARRVRIFNQNNGQAVDGALFKRDASGGGASVLISSEAAQLLGMDVGTPAELRIVAVSPVQRDTQPAQPTDQVAETESTEPVEAEQDAQSEPTGSEPETEATESPAEPETTETAEATETDPDGEAAAATAVRTPTPRPSVPEPQPEPEPEADRPAKEETEFKFVTADEPEETETAAKPEPKEEPKTAARTSTLKLPFIQAGIFGVEANATKLVKRIEAKDLPAVGKTLTSKGRKLTRVLAGPFETVAERNAALRTIRGMGLKDAAPVRR